MSNKKLGMIKMETKNKLKIMGFGLAGILGLSALDNEREVTRSVWVMPNDSYQKTTLQVIVDKSRAYCVDLNDGTDTNQFPWDIQQGDIIDEPIPSMYSCEMKLPGKYDFQGEAWLFGHPHK